MSENTKIFDHKVLKNFCFEIFKAMGSSESDALLASDVLIKADLRGIDSHGVARLIGYVRLWEIDRANMTPQIKIEHETLSTATVNGDKGLGLVVAPKAMNIAIEKAKNCGSGWVAVKNSNHFGIAGYHTMMALEHGMIGFAMTNASPLVAPTFSRERLLGTNPISVAIPAFEEPPFIMDMATTTAANGKLEIHQRKNLSTPDGWIQDKIGDPTNDPYGVAKGGALLPLGSDYAHGSHKGYCLGAMVDILSAVLPGAGYGPWAPPFVTFLPLPEHPVGEGLGHFLGAIRIDGFRPKEEFLSHMDNWIRKFRSSQPVDINQSVLVPGDPERENENFRIQNGIPLIKPVIESLEEVGEKFKIPFKN